MSKSNSLELIHKKVPKKQMYIVTCAQNATPAFHPFLKTLLKDCEVNKGRLIVIPIRYSNPTSIFQDVDHDWWDPLLEPFLTDIRQDLHPSLALMADIKTSPTAVDPLSGMESISGTKSCIFGHPKLAMRCLPTTANDKQKVIWTTGAVTVPNYTDSKAGKKGEFHHSYSAIKVEIVGDKVFTRDLCAASDGSYIDLGTQYKGNKVTRAPKAEALVMGDIHALYRDPDVEKATFIGDHCLVKRIRPKRLIYHDLLDFAPNSHHNKNKPFLRMLNQSSGLDSVLDELRETFDFINTHGKGYTNVVVASNHNEHLDRWLDETDWRELSQDNALLYLDTARYKLRNGYVDRAKRPIVPDAFSFWGEQLLENGIDTVFLSRNDSYTIKDVELANHGDMGPNGSRGNIKSIARLGIKHIFGHTHSAAIFEGARSVGTSSLKRMGYNKGPSSWAHAHVILNANSKRQTLFIVNGKYARNLKLDK